MRQATLQVLEVDFHETRMEEGRRMLRIVERQPLVAGQRSCAVSALGTLAALAHPARGDKPWTTWYLRILASIRVSLTRTINFTIQPSGPLVDRRVGRISSALPTSLIHLLPCFSAVGRLYCTQDD